MTLDEIKNSIKNTIAAMSSNILTILIGLVAQAVFIRISGRKWKKKSVP